MEFSLSMPKSMNAKILMEPKYQTMTGMEGIKTFRANALKVKRNIIKILKLLQYIKTPCCILPFCSKKMV